MALATAPDRHRQRLILALAYATPDASASAVQPGVTSVYHTDLVVAALGLHADLVAGYVNLALGHLRYSRHAPVDQMEARNQDLEAYRRRSSPTLEMRDIPTSPRLQGQKLRAPQCDAGGRAAPPPAQMEEQDPADCRRRSLPTWAFLASFLRM
ncbi:hypothetical protein EDB92DRAFT_1944612 [Lactarius akahatsu]|uniref:Uncharacterized protein n=1 Tax=Lactarius akahatsu TaxID=416441 RepID=A0AAD4LJY8_9AGAM|nr:hypothetical protein EDB92DRAFT_1944612 [Lactarius akahatsu]